MLGSGQILKLEASSGELLQDYIERCIATAEASGCLVEATHNGTAFNIAPSHGAQVWVAYHTSKSR